MARLAPHDPSVGAPRAAEVRARIEKYEEWIAKLEQTRAVYERHVPRYRWGFAAFTAAGWACFAFGRFYGLWGAISTTFISLAAQGMLKTRFWELDEELAANRREVALLRKSIE